MQIEQLRNLIDSPELRRGVSARDLALACLERLDACQPTANALVTTTPDIALMDAGTVDARRAAGRPLPLDGMPIVVKDNVHVAGVPTTANSLAFGSSVEADDAESVRRLRAAGAVILGKANLQELAFGTTTANPSARSGLVRNPWDMRRSAGGSSSGSAVAVALDGCIAAVGTDTGGSVRIPAAFTGVSGIRPTYGRVSTRGVVPLSRSFDSVGPLARTVEDAGRLLQVMSGHDTLDPWSAQQAATDDGHWVGRRSGVNGRDIRGLRVGVAEGPVFADVDGDISSVSGSAVQALGDLGAEIRPLEVPFTEELCTSIAILIRAEAFAFHRERYERSPELFSSEIADRFRLASETPGWRVADALRDQAIWHHQVGRLFDQVDLIASPTTRHTAPLLERPDPIAITVDLTYMTYPWSLAHVPAMALPCGVTSAGMPVSLQLAAGAWREDLLVRVGRAFQNATDWHLARPPDPCGGA